VDGEVDAEVPRLGLPWRSTPSREAAALRDGAGVGLLVRLGDA